MQSARAVKATREIMSGPRPPRKLALGFGCGLKRRCRATLGEIVETKQKFGLKALCAGLVLTALWLCGCGGSSSANVITVTVTDSLEGQVVVTQADTITATVTGPDTVNGVADVNVMFACYYTTTTTSSTGTVTTNPKVVCPTDGTLGTFSNVQPTTEIYTAPSVLPDQTKYPGLIIIIQATSDANTSKTGTLNITLDSGITVAVNPSSATLALNEMKSFSAIITTDTTPGDVTWGITNTNFNQGGTPSIANTYTTSTPQCSPSCGTLTVNAGVATYTAPAILPQYSSTTSTTISTSGTVNNSVTIYAISKQDTTRYGLGTITLVTGGAVTFNSLWPTIVPQGGALADVFLNATNLTSQISLTLSFASSGSCPSNNSIPIDAGSNALKVFFTPSTYGATTGPTSTGARLRLSSQLLTCVGTYTVHIVPDVTQTTPIATFSFDVVPVRPGLVASYPADIAQASSNATITLDGGYYGALGNLVVGANLNGSTLNFQTPAVGSDPRRLTSVPLTSINSTPGLVPINVTNTLDINSPSTVYSNISILPAYANTSISPSSLPSDMNGNSISPCTAAAMYCLPADVNGNTPFVLCTPANGPATGCPYLTMPYIPLGAGSLPDAIALDPITAYAAIAEAGTNSVAFLNLSTTPPSLAGTFATGGTLPTGVAIDHNVCTKGSGGVCSTTNNIVAVANYQSQTLTVLTVPGGALLETIPLNNLIPPSGGTTNSNTSPYPYSVGIDPFTHRALVAFASTDAGFVVNLDQTQSPSICLPGYAPADGTSYCPVALATLNTGTNPQIAYEPGAHLAYVTPGGAGTLTAVNLSSPSQGPLAINNAVRTANVVTITMAANTPHNIVPGTTPTVLISGLPPGTSGSSFNGAFTVAQVLSATTFTYVQTGVNDTSTSATGQQGYLSFGTNALTYSITPTVQGIDINPITHSAVLADPNASGISSGGPQITYVDSLDQAVSSQNLCLNENLAIVTPTPACSPEVGVSAVAFQPFTNTVVALRYDTTYSAAKIYNNQISLLDPSSNKRVTIVETGQLAGATTSFTPTGSTTPLTINLDGALAVDPVHNLALAVNSGSGTITPLYLGTIQPLQIESVSTPAVDANDGAVMPATLSQSVLIQSTALPQSISGIQIFGRGFNSTSMVRLDGVPLPPSDVAFSSSKPNELDVTIPAANGAQNILTGPRNFGLDVANSDGTHSNVMDFRVVEAIPIPACTGVNAAPGAVAIANDLVGSKKNYAVVTETGCAQVALISLNPDATFATFTTIAAGNGPTGVATIPRFGYAVVSNETDGTASILNLTNGTKVVADVTVGKNPEGVAIEQETGLAVVVNEGSNTATVIDMTPLQASPVGTLAPLTTATDQEPIAVAIDPDGGSNATGLAVVTTLDISTTPAQGALDQVDLSLAVPAKDSVSTTTIGSIPTGIIYDPAAGLFYATESDSNAFISYNPSTGGTPSTIQVGINPYSVASNFQTSSILTVNADSNTISIIDSQTFQTKATLGVGSASLFSAAIEPFSNLAVIADQSNNRVLLFPVPH